MEIFWQVLAAFVLFGVVGTIYCNAVHWLGAWITRRLPARLVRILSKRLWVTEYDRARAYDRIALEAEDKLNKRFVR